jgi:hypothetical protein
MQTNKALYIVIGVLVGIVAVLAVTKLSTQEAYAAPGAKQSESFATGDFIALASSTRSDTNILWLIDTKNKKLLLYEYYSENVVRLKCVRDIQYDINIPDGVQVPNRKDAEPSPMEVRSFYDNLKKLIDAEQKR